MTPRILVVDVDRSWTAGTAAFLRSSGYSAMARHDTRGTFDALAGIRFDAIVLSAGLPDGDGFEMCRMVRTRSDAGILMITAEGQDIQRILGLEAGADDCLARPVGRGELLARLRAIARRRRSRSVPVDRPLEFGRLRIERGARVVRLDGIPKPMTHRQYALLLALAENDGRVLGRGALMDALGGSEGKAPGRSLDVQVCRLRSLIEDDPRHPRRLVTVRGVGYAFERSRPPRG